jgi:hypothetical protein
VVHIHLRIINALGFNFRIYDARHTFAAKAIEDGVDLITLATAPGRLKRLARCAQPSEKLQMRYAKKKKGKQKLSKG